MTTLKSIFLAGAAAAVALPLPGIFGLAAKTAGGVSVSTPVVITITRWTTDAERPTAVNALKSGGNAAAKKVLDAMPDAGTIQIGERKTPLKFARTLPTGSGRVVTVVTSQPILYLGAGVPESKVKAGFDLAYAMFISIFMVIVAIPSGPAGVIVAWETPAISTPIADRTDALSEFWIIRPNCATFSAGNLMGWVETEGIKVSFGSEMCCGIFTS